MGARSSAHWHLFKGRAPINAHRTARSKSSQTDRTASSALSWCLIMWVDSMRAVVGKRSAPFFLFYNFVLCSFFMINAFCSFGIKSIRAMAQVTAIPSTSTQFQRTRLMNATFTSWAFSPSYMGDSDGAVASRPFILNHPPTWTTYVPTTRL